MEPFTYESVEYSNGYHHSIYLNENLVMECPTETIAKNLCIILNSRAYTFTSFCYANTDEPVAFDIYKNGVRVKQVLTERLADEHCYNENLKFVTALNERLKEKNYNLLYTYKYDKLEETYNVYNDIGMLMIGYYEEKNAINMVAKMNKSIGDDLMVFDYSIYVDDLQTPPSMTFKKAKILNRYYDKLGRILIDVKYYQDNKTSNSHFLSATQLVE